ncbi:MAG: hypothetical protein ACR2FE_12670 [Aeromicrobium sp.]
MNRRALGLVAAVCLCVACGPNGQDDPDGTPTGPPPVAALPDPISADRAPRVDIDQRMDRSWVLGGSPDWMESAFGSVWVRRDAGDVLRVDPGSGKIVSEIVTVTDTTVQRCQGFGADRTGIWSCVGENRLVRIDPDADTAGRPSTVEKIYDQSRLAATEQGLWVIAADGKSVSVIDRDGRRGTTVELGMFCTNLSRGGGALWVLCPSADAVLKIDPRKGRVVKSVGIDLPRQAAVADDLWVSFAGGVAQIDTASLAVKAVYNVFAGLESTIWADDDAVWARGAESEEFLVRIDPAARRVAEVIETSDLLGLGDVVVGGGWVWATAEEQGVLVRLAPRP